MSKWPVDEDYGAEQNQHAFCPMCLARWTDDSNPPREALADNQVMMRIALMLADDHAAADAFILKAMFPEMTLETLGNRHGLSKQSLWTRVKFLGETYPQIAGLLSRMGKDFKEELGVANDS